MFRIGMKVVYVGTDLDFDPNPGKTVHTIVGMKQGCCNRNKLKLDVGKRVPSNHAGTMCQFCGNTTDSSIFWKNSIWFRPVQDQYTSEEIEAVNIDELTEVLNEPEYVEN